MSRCLSVSPSSNNETRILLPTPSCSIIDFVSLPGMPRFTDTLTCSSSSGYYRLSRSAMISTQASCE